MLATSLNSNQKQMSNLNSIALPERGKFYSKYMRRLILAINPSNGDPDRYYEFVYPWTKYCGVHFYYSF